MKDSLWSMDLFRCESASLRTHWVLVVMDQYSRRIIGFGVHAGTVDGVALCRMFNRAIRWQLEMPKYLRVLEVTEIKKVPYVPLSHRLSSGSLGPYAENAWTARYSGPPPTWRPGYSISNTIIMSIARTPDAKGNRR